MSPSAPAGASAPLVSPIGGTRGLLTPAQKKFNSQIQRIHALQETLAQWRSAVDDYRVRHARDFLPLLEDYRQACAQLARLLDRGAALKLAKADRVTLEDTIVTLADSLEQSSEDPSLREEMRTLAERYAPPPPSQPESTEATEAAEAAEAATSPAWGGAQPGAFAQDEETPAPEDLSSEAFFARIEAQWRARQEAFEQARAHRHAQRDKKPTLRQQHEQAAEQQARQSVREVFRKLASALHPDREPDATARERKTALMQRANQAYAAYDLLALLQLQLEVELIDAGHIGGLPDERLRHYNRVLADQIKTLQQNVAEAEDGFRMEFGSDRHGPLRPSALAAQLSRQLHQIKTDTHQLRLDLRALADPAALKRWLKQQRAAMREYERRARLEDDEDDGPDTFFGR